MKLKLLTAVAALVASTSVIAGESEKFLWANLGDCSGLYLAGQLESDKRGFKRIEDRVAVEREGLDASDAFDAGKSFGYFQSMTQGFYINERKHYPNGDWKELRLQSIIEQGCEHY